MSQQPPDWWAQRNGPRLGCADVTIVSMASITAFIIILLVLGRSDFLLERLPGANANPTIGASKNSDSEKGITVAPRAIPVFSPTPSPIPPTLTPTTAPTLAPTSGPSPTPTPSFKRVNVKQTCRLRADASTLQTVLKLVPPGTVIKQLGDQKFNEGVTWFSVELDDGSGLRGWMQEICFT